MIYNFSLVDIYTQLPVIRDGHEQCYAKHLQQIPEIFEKKLYRHKSTKNKF